MEDKDILIILAIFCIILGGMCIAFLCKIVKKLVHDHKIIKVRLFIYNKELLIHKVKYLSISTLFVQYDDIFALCISVYWIAL